MARRVAVRFTAATNKTVSAEIAAGRFREDLYFRLNVVPIEIPPLRARRPDVPQLVEHFVAQFTEQSGLARKEFEKEAVKRLTAYDWPGNIRELRNAVERLLILAAGPVVTPEDVERLAGVGTREAGSGGGTTTRRGSGGAQSRGVRQAARRAYLLAELEGHDWDVAEKA